jgi:hypothetical protein
VEKQPFFRDGRYSVDDVMGRKSDEKGSNCASLIALKYYLRGAVKDPGVVFQTRP